MESAAARPLLIFLLAALHLAVIAYAENGNPPVHQPDQHHPPPPPPHHPAPPPEHPHHPSPAHPPTHPPEPHYPFPRRLVAVEGGVFCQSCKYAGKNDFNGATPIKGAEVKLECKNTAKLTTLTAKTDEHGSFLFLTHNVTNYAFDKCKVFLVSSPLSTCDKPTNLFDGLTGAKLRVYQTFTLDKLPFALYTTGPFAFLPKCG